MSGPSGESCPTCYYHDDTTTFCHRYPPRPVLDLERVWSGDDDEPHYITADADRQTFTVKTCWCGEWRKRR